MIVNKFAIASLATLVVRPVQAETIYDIAGTADGFGALANMVNLAGLSEALSGDEDLTVFAPVDSAFSALPSDLVQKYSDPTWKPQLQDILLHHVVAGKVMSTDLSDGMVAPTLNGDDVTIGLNPPTVMGATNEAPSNILVDDGLVDISADNGVIHAIDSVLTPTSLTSDIVAIASGSDMFSTLVTAVVEAGLAEALSGPGPLTVFAPTNDAFAALPEGTLDSLLKPESKDQLVEILKYHVVDANAHSSSLASGDVMTLSGDSVALMVAEDGGVKVNAANVVKADVIASNGIVHVIDAVLLPPSTADATEVETDSDEDSATMATGAPTMKPTEAPPSDDESGASVYGIAVAAASVAAGAMVLA